MSKARLATIVMAAVIFLCGGYALAAEGAARPAAPAAPAAVPATLESRLTGLQKAIEEYSRQTSGGLPRELKDLAVILPNKEKDLINPETGNELMMNATMARQHERAIRTPKTFITFYAEQDTPNKGRCVIYATGEIKYLDEKEFPKALVASKAIPLTGDEMAELREAAEDRRREMRDQQRELQRQQRQQQR